MSAPHQHVGTEMSQIAVNARFLVHSVTGMQRYAREVVARFGDEVELLRPKQPRTGVTGHLWEQLMLPRRLQGRLLWSPNNTGPVVIRDQVCTFTDINQLDHPEWFSRRYAAWYQWLLPKLAQTVQHIITISEFSKSRIVDRLSVVADKVTVVLPGVDKGFTRKPADEVKLVREVLGIGTGQYILSLGSLVPNKNLARLLQSWDRVLPELPDDISLVVAGATRSSRVFSRALLDGPRRRVRFTGYVKDADLPALYSGALCFVFPSLYEGFGLPPLEAMACGTPVVCSRTSALPEVVGEAAKFVDPYDIDSIADGLLHVAKDPGLRGRLQEAGPARAARFSWDRTAAMTWEVLQNAKTRRSRAL